MQKCLIAIMCVCFTALLVSGQGATSRPAVTSRPSRINPNRPIRPNPRPMAQANKPALPEYVNLYTSAIDSKPVTLPGAYAGKLVLVHVWGTWCPSCTREAPFWAEAFKAYHSKGVEFVGIALDKDRLTGEERVRTSSKSKGMTWPQVYADSSAISEQLGAKSIPKSLLVDGDTGKVLIQGDALRKKNLIPRIEEFLALKQRDKASGPKTTTSKPAN